jgi:hypothetical protein
LTGTTKTAPEVIVSTRINHRRQARNQLNQLVRAGVVTTPAPVELTQLELRRGNRAQPIPSRKPEHRGGRAGERQRWERDCA